MKKSDTIRQQIAALSDEAQAIIDRAESAGREMTAVEQTEFNGVLAQIDPLKDTLAAQVETETNLSVHRALRCKMNEPLEPILPVSGRVGGLHGGQPQVLTPTMTAFKGGGNKEQALRDAYDCGLWLLANVAGDGAARQKLESRRGSSWLATQTENSPVNGGYLVPAPLEAAIIVSRQEAGAIRKLARVVKMSSETLSLPKQTDGTTVYYPGEEGSITASDLDFGRANLITQKRAIYSLISNELRDDSIVAVVDLLAEDMGNQFALKEDSEGINGDGTSTYGGELGIKTAIAAATASISTAATGHDTWPELDFSDFAAVMAKLPAKYRAGNNLAWLVSPSFKWAVMDRLAIGANGAMSQVFVDGMPQDRFLGYPVVLSDYCPTATAAATVCAYFGNWQRALLLGDRTEVRIATSEHIAFQTDQTAVRATVRYDINFHEPGDTSSAGAVVALKTAA